MNENLINESPLSLYKDDATINHRDGYSLFIRTLDLNTDFDGIKKRLESFIN